ncbi:hypothetical protein ACAG26_24160 [Mycobacterium sp. pUA109]|uniref:hypothetical protein n=1 Tax=Mycobacterium sp. pUA109 TaxID=3238982 RepID=UPI00351B8610
MTDTIAHALRRVDELEQLSQRLAADNAHLRAQLDNALTERANLVIKNRALVTVVAKQEDEITTAAQDFDAERVVSAGLQAELDRLASDNATLRAERDYWLAQYTSAVSS